PEVIPQLRATRRKEAAGHFLVLSAADPLDLAGITTPGQKIAAVGGNRVLYRDGIPVAAREGGNVIELHSSAAEFRAEIKNRLAK
ncbi:MAG: hypothetical protein V3T65_01065, partial [Acidobacteriota bacterium]